MSPIRASILNPNITESKSKKSPFKVFKNLLTNFVSPTLKSYSLKYNSRIKKMIFKRFSYILIISNSVILCIDSDSIDQNIISKIDFCLLMLFYVEILVKIAIFQDFFASFLNFLEFILLLLNTSAQIYFTSKGFDVFNNHEIKSYNVIRTFQIWRILRILISSNFFKGIAILIIEFLKILKKMISLLVLLFIFLTLFTMIGKDLFASVEPSDINTHIPLPIYDEEFERINFSNFSNAFLANFLIFIDEEWHIIMLTHMKKFSSVYSIFFIINLLLSTFFFNKIFLASLINKMIESKNMKKLLTGKYSKSQTIHNFFRKIIDKFKELQKKYFLNYLQKKCKKDRNLINLFINIFIPHEKHEEENKGFYMKLKTNVRKLTKNKIFENFMFFSICLSLIIFALNDPFQSSDSPYNKILKYIDIPIFVIFTLELIMDIISSDNGLLNASIIWKSFLCFIYLFYFLYDLFYLKLLLILRLFLLISYSKELKLAFQALIKSLGDILQLFFFFALFSVGFGLIGVKLLKGAYWSCNGLNEEYSEYVYIKQDCFDYGGDWKNSDFNFDNILKALELLFIIANSEGWLILMYYEKL